MKQKKRTMITSSLLRKQRVRTIRKYKTEIFIPVLVVSDFIVTTIL